MGNCPLCGHKVEAYHEVTFDKPYIHNNPYDGIHIYGAYLAPKETICYDEKFLHFAFYDSENNLVDHRLVQLGVENPTTKTATDELWSSDPEDFDEPDEWDERDDDEDEDDFEPCPSCDGHPACDDFGCAYGAGLGNMVQRELNSDDL